mmetsp:Transcript_36210/g.80569  ORF Transcript_36210/g.80569 Transcript_36210/m.80569 type:complete len:252 (-) Transcript_36210:295-1050(-)
MLLEEAAHKAHRHLTQLIYLVRRQGPGQPVQHLITQVEAVVVAKLAQHCPCALQPAPLNEEHMQEQEALQGQAALRNPCGQLGHDHLLDVLQLIRCQLHAKANLLEAVEFTITQRAVPVSVTHDKGPLEGAHTQGLQPLLDPVIEGLQGVQHCFERVVKDVRHHAQRAGGAVEANLHVGEVLYRTLHSLPDRLNFPFFRQLVCFTTSQDDGHIWFKALNSMVPFCPYALKGLSPASIEADHHCIGLLHHEV